ncbi:MAG: hypothetical protein M3529_13430, partial [Actinomycetota bacterium]|nr:hypothetical protein [Actinomycetota bacterium]
MHERHEVLGGQDQLQPDGVAGQGVARQGARAGVLGAADAVLDTGVSAVKYVKGREVGVGLVGQKAGEAGTVD